MYFSSEDRKNKLKYCKFSPNNLPTFETDYFYPSMQETFPVERLGAQQNQGQAYCEEKNTAGALLSCQNVHEMKEKRRMKALHSPFQL